mgnify:FL=1
MNYVLSRLAQEDIEALLESSLVYFGEQQTQQYVTGLEYHLELLASRPGLGVDVSDMREGYRKFPYASHVIYYTVHDKGICVVRLLHSRMDERRHI